MAYGGGKILLNHQGRPAVRARESDAAGLPTTGEERLELQRLRMSHAQLLRELQALKQREAQIQRLADRDELTGLYGRRRMQELLDTSIAQASQLWQCVGLLFIDLNGFKAINDEYGHSEGDKILTTVATRIGARVRTGDFVCRYGGDGFVVSLPNIPDAAAVTRVGDTIRECVAFPYWIHGSEQHLTAAIGESMYPHDGDNADELLRRADQAMYRMKRRLARPMLSLGGTPHRRPSRRRGDNA